MAIFEWLEGWYNPYRRHSSLGYLSPINYERKLSINETTAIQITTRPRKRVKSRGRAAVICTCRGGDRRTAGDDGPRFRQ